MSAAAPVSYAVAFTAGLLSILSPCVLPLIPAYVTFLTGRTLEELTTDARPRAVWLDTLLQALWFFAGFALIFILLGASATALGNFIGERQGWLRRVGGLIIIAFGLHELGWLTLPWISQERRWHLPTKPLGWLGSLLVGMAFAVGWSPCIGPILAAILLYASSSDSVRQGVLLLAVYSLGFGIPFIASALLLDRFLVTARWFQRHARAVSITSGLFLILMGALIATNLFTLFTGYLAALVPPPR